MNYNLLLEELTILGLGLSEKPKIFDISLFQIIDDIATKYTVRIKSSRTYFYHRKDFVIEVNIAFDNKTFEASYSNKDIAYFLTGKFNSRL